MELLGASKDVHRILHLSPPWLDKGEDERCDCCQETNGCFVKSHLIMAQNILRAFPDNGSNRRIVTLVCNILERSEIE